MKRLWLPAFLLILAVSGFAEEKPKVSLTDEVNKSYRVLLDLNNTFEDRKKAAAHLKDMFVNGKDETVIDAIVDLLLYAYDQSNYKEENDKEYKSDMIALELIQILELSGDPRIFPALLNIVVKPNHAQATIMEAWKAIKMIKWKDK
ncbi:MAG: hypothetical protein A2Y33_14255 [Spirochaetes bacterium GWF1_51_8]|nr:MAG: hypothetical protein A2Y33_14255 [Spirochaetes bacterium GWF1_51_8]